MKVTYSKRVPTEVREELSKIAHDYESLRKQSSKVTIGFGNGSLTSDDVVYHRFYSLHFSKAKTLKGILRVVLRDGKLPITSEQPLVRNQ